MSLNGERNPISALFQSQLSTEYIDAGVDIVTREDFEFGTVKMQNYLADDVNDNEKATECRSAQRLFESVA